MYTLVNVGLKLPYFPQSIHRNVGCPKIPNPRFGDNRPTVPSKN